MRISIINPLQGTLSHYSEELRETLSQAFQPCEVTVTSFNEPSADGSSRVDWLRRYFTALWRHRRQIPHDLVIVTWPVLGYLDLIILQTLLGRAAAVIVHDGAPLVRAIGYGRLTRLLMAVLRPRVRVFVHTELARADLSSRFLRTTSVRVPHPISKSFDIDYGERRTDPVRVLGQYKKDRDIELLQSLANAGVEIEVLGRGWPPIPGVRVVPQFLSEDDLLNAIRRSRAILIPYVRFYQSGIAVRAIELGSPVVSQQHEFMSTLAPGREWFVSPAADTSAWTAALGRAAAERPRDVEFVRDEYFEYCVRSWQAAIRHSGVVV